jgi:hypothetical protein
MSYFPCTHKSTNDFSRQTPDGRIWKCSGCGKEGFWDDNWSYYGSIECKKCWAPDIDWVACSDRCMDKKL